MPVKWKHGHEYAMYYCTFTCFRWLHLFEIVNSYDIVYKWFDVLKKEGWQVIGFTIMPNHVHVVLYFPKPGYSLNKVIGNAKRFMAYEIIKRLEKMKRYDLLEFLFDAVTKKEKKKSQRHRVFEESFDAKGINSEKFLIQKLNYIHYNPVRGKWNLLKDYTEYEHSSASLYERGEIKNYAPFDLGNFESKFHYRRVVALPARPARCRPLADSFTKPDGVEDPAGTEVSTPSIILHEMLENVERTGNGLSRDAAHTAAYNKALSGIKPGDPRYSANPGTASAILKKQK